MTTNSGYSFNNNSDYEPFDLLTDDVGSCYGLKSTVAVGVLYILIHRNEKEVRIKTGDTETVFSIDVTNHKEIERFSKKIKKLKNYNE